ncbi:hypothetical protein GCM10028796_12550 [Ramlibacter monticola]|uniref:Uncharacterized protein n=1 Tax=Ramlibacter monticola TaxID=1926872 RepID=A0A937CSH3_9BURK|nr:hypothetical protein [Ramlibacter monticola]MBL0390107.1 hypothetical protein [Ramlibacter monticola]
MDWRDSNMAGDMWTWKISLTRAADGSFELNALQKSMTGEDDYEIDGGEGLRGGEAVLGAIRDLFLDDMLQDCYEDVHWKSIFKAVRALSAPLAKEMAAALANEEGEDEDEEE